jgi:Ca2+/Na+ antiporter
MLVPGACLSLGWSELFQRLYITGAYLIAILMPLLIFFDFNDFRIKKRKIFSILVVFFGAFFHKP